MTSDNVISPLASAADTFGSFVEIAATVTYALVMRGRRNSAHSVPGPVIAAYLLLVLITMGYSVKSGYPPRFYDEKQYLAIAQSLVDGKGFMLNGSPTAYRPPAWPALLAIVIECGIPVRLLTLSSWMLIVGASSIAMFLAIAMAKNRWASLAGPLILIYPPNVFTAGTLYPQALATFLLFVSWLCAWKLKDDSSGSARSIWAVIAGLALAATALAVPTLAPTALILLVWLTIGIGRQSKLLLAFSAIAPVSIWTIRNWLVLGSPVPLSTSSGVNLLIGNNSSAGADTGVAVRIDVSLAEAAHMDEVERNRYFTSQALGWIKTHPCEAGYLFVRKTLNYFNPSNNIATQGQAPNELQTTALYVSFLLLIVFLLVRIRLRRSFNMWPSEWVMIGLFIANAPIMGAVFTRARFRQPLDSLMIVEATLGLLAIILTLRTLRKGMPPLPKETTTAD